MRTEQNQEQGALVAKLAFPRRPDAVRPARNWAARWYRRFGGTEEQAETCALLVSELAANAVLHAEGARFEVTVKPSLVVEVRDGSKKRPELTPFTEGGENGRGVYLVAELSACYEVVDVEDGKISRFQL